MEKDIRNRKRAEWAIFVAYCALMMYLLFFQRVTSEIPLPFGEYIERYTNFTPFYTLKKFVYLLTEYKGAPYLVRSAFVNIVGNVIMFAPMGMLLPELWAMQKKIIMFLATSVLIIAFVETVQLITRLGSCDIDDFILNIFGGFIGFTIRALLVKINAVSD